MRKPPQLRDIPLILSENEVIPRDLAKRLSAAVGLRNRLVHSYADIDHEIIYNVLRNDLADLEVFVVAIGRISEEEA